jgi:hypothetical protein
MLRYSIDRLIIRIGMGVEVRLVISVLRTLHIEHLMDLGGCAKCEE